MNNNEVKELYEYINKFCLKEKEKEILKDMLNKAYYLGCMDGMNRVHSAMECLIGNGPVGVIK
jgi:hypothetical protein